MPCCLGATEEEMCASFLDIVSVLGAHFHFSYEDYENMPISELIGLCGRYKKYCDKMSSKNRGMR